jgi:hypothetical protein
VLPKALKPQLQQIDALKKETDQVRKLMERKRWWAD